MKKIITLTYILLALLPMKLTAHDFELDGIYYNINGNEAIVTFKGNYSYSNGYNGNVTIPNTVSYNGITYNVSSIGNEAFSGCNELTSVSIPNSVTEIGNYSFSYCEGLTSVTIPNSVTTIGNHAFLHCCGLTSITIPNSVTTIGSHAFTDCWTLTSASIPSQLKVLGDAAFLGCFKLESNMYIPKTVTYIGLYPFAECDSLTILTVDKDNPIYDSRDNCNAIIETSTNTLICGINTSTIPESITSIGDYAFRACYLLESIYIPEKVKKIGECAFYLDSKLRELNIPASVTAISDWTFGGCHKLKVTIPNSITYIGSHAFYGCSLLNSNIPNAVIHIGDWAFAECTSMTSISIPNTIRFIGDNAFYGCNSSSSGAYYWNTPTDVYSYITNVSAVSIGSEVFNLVINDYSNRTLYVPYGTSAEYQADTKWSQYFGSIVEMNGPSGDMNGDGTISIRDVTTLIDYLLGAESGSFSVDNADVNGDGQITIADATALIDMLLSGDN